MGLFDRAGRVIAMTHAARWQHVFKRLPAGMTLCRDGITPHFHFRLAAVRTGHVVWIRLLWFSNQHEMAPNIHLSLSDVPSFTYDLDHMRPSKTGSHDGRLLAENVEVKQTC